MISMEFLRTNTAHFKLLGLSVGLFVIYAYRHVEVEVGSEI